MTLKGIKFCCAGLIVVFAGVILAGCQANGQSTLAASSKSAGDTYTSKTLATSYTGALDASNQLMLGGLGLEGTDNAFTSEQAKTLLPLVQSLQGQVMKSNAERNAVWASVEARLTQAQLSAIADMHLTQDDLQAWMRDNSQGPGAGPMPGGAGPQGTRSAGPGQGGPLPQGTPGTRPAQGGTRPQGAPGAPPASAGAAGANATGMGPSNVLLNSLIRLLATKSAGSQTATPMPTIP